MRWIRTRARLAAGIFCLVLAFSALLTLQAGPRVLAAALLTQTPLNTNGSSPLSVSYSPAAVAGKLLVVICSANVASTITGPTGFTTILNEGTIPAQAMFYKVAAGGETSESCSFTGAGGYSIQIYEYSGIEDTSPLDANNTTPSTGTSATASSGSVTTNNTNDLLIAGVVCTTNCGFGTTWTSSFTNENSGSKGSGSPSGRIAYASADRSVSSTGTYSTTLSLTSNQWRGQIAAFKIAPAVVFGGDIVDNTGATVGSPSVAMATKSAGFTCQTSTGSLGVSTQKIRVTNTNPADKNGWTLAMAATSGTGSTWTAGTKKYDYNDSGGSGCADSDSDSFGGQLTIDPTSETITPESSPEAGCTTTGVSKLGSSTAYSSGTSSITIASAGATSSHYCYWDITGLTLSQKIPATQAGGSYSIGFTLTLTAL